MIRRIQKRGFLNSIAVLGAVAALGACSALDEPFEPHTTNLHTDQLITGTASLGHTFVHLANSPRFICSQPQPDAAFDTAEEGNISIALISTGDEGGGESTSANEVELAGRTPGVLMARELFFRACEFSFNFNLSKAEAITLYNKTLEAIAANWTVEAGNTTVTIGDTISNTSTTAVQETSQQTLSETTSATTSDTTSDTVTQDESSSGSSSSE